MSDLMFITEQVKLKDLKGHPRNYRQHPEDQLEHIITSIKENGFYRNIVIAKDNTILAGHGVAKACKKMKLDKVPVIRLDVDSNHPKALKVLTGDNEIGHLGEIDDRILTDLLKDIKEIDDSGLLGTGFDDQMLANLLFVTRPKSEIKTIDHAKEWVGMPEYEVMEEPLKCIVSFETSEDRSAFYEMLGCKYTNKTKSIWYPLKDQDDPSAVRFKG